MNSRNLLGVVAGQSSIVAILTLTLVLSIAGAPLLQQQKIVAQRIGAEVAITKADALSEAILAEAGGARALDRQGDAFSAIHLRNALSAGQTPQGDFARQAVDALRKKPQEPYYNFTDVAETPHLLYAVSDGAGGVLTLDLPLDAERALIGRFFGQSYLSASALGYILIGLLMFAAFALRHYLRTLAALPPAERRETIMKGLGRSQRGRRNLLPWLLAMCAGIFAADLSNMLDSAVGIGYVLAVMLSLSSNRHWHVTLTASFGAALLLAAPIISPYDSGWWSYLETHSVSVFAILMTGFFGSANLRKSQAEALALAEAARSRIETSELREALERAEAAEASNRRMVERMRMANESADISVWEWNIRTGMTSIDDGSPMIERIGGTREIRDLEYVNMCVHPEERAEWTQFFTDAALGRSGDFVSRRYRNVRPDGEIRHLQLHARVLRNSKGQPTRILGVDWDVTDEELARAEIARTAAELRQATIEAEEASRSKSTFLATMSHEIRTPMNGVIGMTGLLLDTPLDRLQRDYAETIRASADSLLTILNDILDFSKIEAGKLDIESLELDLRSNVDDVGSIMAFQAAAKGLELVVDVRPEVPERVLGDPQRIRQCLLNLVGNAIKFTQSGEVVLEVCCVGRQSGRALVHFEVRDTGIGIEQHTLDKLFQPFTQADSSTTRRFGGTGLGLSIVRKLVDLMGGQVGAQSQPDKGSTFWFTLPLEAVVTEDPQTQSKPAPTGRRVLLVDDNETNCRVLSGQMTHAGYDVSTAPSAQQALAMLRAPGRQPFEAVVLDYQMPDMDGAMLGEAIMRARGIAPTRLMLLTSLDRSGDMQRFSDIGFCAYLTKPVRTRELLDCLKRALSHEAEEWHMHSQPIITRGTLVATENPRRQYAGRVLLVEDNAINQRVARRFLERFGCEVHVVGDGAQAVVAYQRDEYAFILMDMQMPVMDGLEATQCIRELETRAGARRTPIVALTANAMMGTLERCLEAGMDDYLTKPLDISRLQDALDRFMKPPGQDASDVPAAATTTAAAPPSSGRSASNRDSPGLAAEIRERIADVAGDDPQFIAELVEAFIASGAETLLEMRAAAHRREHDALGRASHKLKGASANLHVNGLTALALDLETRAKAAAQGIGDATGDWTPDIEKIAREFDRVATAMQAQYEGGSQRRVG